MSRLDELARYVAGELDDADAFEEALFDAPDDPELAFVDAVARLGAKLVDDGTFDMGTTRAEVEALRTRGKSIELVDLGPPNGEGAVRTQIMGRGTDLVCTVLRLGRTDVPFVDTEIEVVALGVTKTIRGGIVDPTDGHLYALCERPLAELTAAAGRSIVRVRRADGDRELLATWDVATALAPL